MSGNECWSTRCHSQHDVPMHDDSGFVLPRVARFVRERLTPALHREKIPAGVAAWMAPGEPVPFAEAVAQ